jgi:hypothetical protein
MVILLNRWFYSASTFFGLIIIRRKDYSIELLNHEYIHVKQQKELLFVGAYIIYILEFIVKLFWYRNIKLAYANISFEREAKAFRHVIGYAAHRKPYSFRHLIYVRKHELIEVSTPNS